MNHSVRYNLDDTQQLTALGKALSVPVRIDILQILCRYELNINEIAEKLNLAASSAASHVKVLEEAGLIHTELLPGVRGSMKVCRIKMDRAEVFFATEKSHRETAEIISMPIGNFVDYKVGPTCGIVSGKGPIGEEDEPRCFYHPDRPSAKLLWFGNGYVEYRFPNHFLQNHNVYRAEISMELCSEDHEYNLDFPSDITLWVNGLDSGTWFCPSDFGGRRGQLNPDWWPDKNTQYGILKTWILEENATYIDEEKGQEIPIRNFHLADHEYISVRLGIKETASRVGGINLFGDMFGDYAQNIVMRLFYD